MTECATEYPAIGMGILIVRGNQILLGKRLGNPNDTDEIKGRTCWCLPGGKLEHGEAFYEGAYREVKEECNLEINIANLKLIAINNIISERYHYVSFGILARLFKGEVKANEPHKIEKWEWFDLNQLPDNIFSPSQYVIDAYRYNYSLDNILSGNGVVL